jgi:hypothetical protein
MENKVGSLRARRYVFHPDEVAEAEAQGLPYVLVPRVLSRRDGWSGMESSPPPIQVINDRTGRRLCRRLTLVQ